jgi:hypothetical protein
MEMKRNTLDPEMEFGEFWNGKLEALWTLVYLINRRHIYGIIFLGYIITVILLLTK